jgi:hypothetical protein
MSRQVLSLVLSLYMTSYIQQTTAAPTDSVVDARQDSNQDSEVGLRTNLSIVEWLAVESQRIDLAENITKACLSQFSEYEDHSVCYGDDRWEWSTINIISVASTLVGLLFGVWLCYYWVQRAILWVLDEEDDTERATTEMPSHPATQLGQDQGIQADAHESNLRGGSAQSQVTDADNRSASRDSHTRVNSACSQVTADDLVVSHALGALQSNSAIPSFAPPDMNVADKPS